MTGPRGGREHADERGAILLIAVMAALLSSVAAYALLMIAMSQTRHEKSIVQRTRARYAAEAGIIKAMQCLWVNPRWSATGALDCTGGTCSIGRDLCGFNGFDVNIELEPCPALPAPCPMRTLRARVQYAVF